MSAAAGSVTANAMMLRASAGSSPGRELRRHRQSRAGIGDLLVFQDRILDRAGRQVGVEGGTCTITALLPDGFQTHCAGTVLLPGGSIAFQGLVSDKPEKRMAVVGGTGRYAGAGGELTVLELGHDEAGTLTVRLVTR